jgi:glycosyltransferase involved in cell wall biosynthesis
MTDGASLSEKRLRLAVDVHGFTRIHQGSRTFIENIYREIPSIDPSVEVVSFGGVESPDFPVSRHLPVDLGSPVKRLTYGSWASLRDQAPDYVHYQYFCPILPIGRSVVTVHDILPLTHPVYFNPRFARQFGVMLGVSVRFAALINAVSDYTRDSLADQYGIDRASIAIVPNAVSRDFFTAVSREEARAYVELTYGLKSYAISISRIEKRKNIPLLIEAVRALNATEFPDLRTVLLGGIDEASGSGCAVTREAIRSGSVVHLCGLSDAEKVKVLRAAAVMVFPSLAEGFGIPPLEGMAAEVPVIVANRTAHGRLYGDSTLTVGGESVEELAEQMRRVLSDEPLRSKLVEQGRRLTQTMTWKASAAALLDSLRKDAVQRASRGGAKR